MKIWRYMDLERFMSLLINKSLFLNRATFFEDKSEGQAFSFIQTIIFNIRNQRSVKLFEDPINFQPERIDLKMALNILAENLYSIVDNNPRIDKDLLRIYLDKYILLFTKNDRNQIEKLNQIHNELLNPEISDLETKNKLNDIFVNCWHHNEFQNNAMWKQYGNNGLSIVSTPEKLISSVKQTYRTKIKKNHVNYIDTNDYTNYNSKSLTHEVMEHLLHNFEDILFYKDIFYKNENEYRFVFIKRNIDFEDFERVSPNGFYLPLENFDFIDEIIISPYASSTLKAIFPKIIEDYGISVDVFKTKLNIS